MLIHCWLKVFLTFLLFSQLDFLRNICYHLIITLILSYNLLENVWLVANPLRFYRIYSFNPWLSLLYIAKSTDGYPDG